jgi:hypothetical protein
MSPATGVKIAALLVGMSWSAPGALAATLTLAPSKDNTLIETAGGELSSGAGADVFAGRTSQTSNSRRRALLAFDLSQLPTGSVVKSAVLLLHRTGGPSSSDTKLEALELYRLLTDWGEGESQGSGGKGADSELGDATWIHTFFEPEDPESAPRWTQPGGDHAPVGVAISSWDEAGFRWDSIELASQVQAWLDAPESNFGWVLIGDETQSSTSVKIASRETVQVDDRPALVIEYVPEPATWLAQMATLAVLPVMKPAHRRTPERLARSSLAGAK